MAKLFPHVMFLLFTISLFISTSSAKVICEKLPSEVCSFAISSTSNRCILESSTNQMIGEIEYQCKTSDVKVKRMSDYIENDQCVDSCGVERHTVGISSDSLLDSKFTSKICSASCYENCPNIVDLYFNLAAGEGVFLPKLCEENRMNPHRAMAELLSSGEALAPGSASAPKGSIEAQSPEMIELGPTTSAKSMAPARKLLSLLDAEAPESSGEELGPAVESMGPAFESMAPARKLLSLLDADAPESSGEELGPAVEPMGPAVESMGPAFESMAPARILSLLDAEAPESSGEELGPAFETMAPSTPLDFNLFDSPASAPAPWPQ